MAPHSLSILFTFLDPTVLETGSSDQCSGGSHAAPGPSSIQSPQPRPRSSLSRLFRRSSPSSTSMASLAHASAPTETPSLTRERLESPTDPAASPSRLPSSPVPLRVKRHSLGARVPTRGSAHAAGYDLYSAETKRISARGRALVDTQLSIAVPPGTYGRIAPRSGLASKFSIDVGAGVVDADYRGVVHVLLLNHNDHDFEVNVGDRIAQLVLERISTPTVVEVLDLDNVPSSPDTPHPETADLEQSPALESEGTTPQRASPSSPSPRVRIPVDQVLGDRDPCPETRTPTKKELQKV